MSGRIQLLEHAKCIALIINHTTSGLIDEKYYLFENYLVLLKRSVAPLLHASKRYKSIAHETWYTSIKGFS